MRFWKKKDTMKQSLSHTEAVFFDDFIQKTASRQYMWYHVTFAGSGYYMLDFTMGHQIYLKLDELFCLDALSRIVWIHTGASQPHFAEKIKELFTKVENQVKQRQQNTFARFVAEQLHWIQQEQHIRRDAKGEIIVDSHDNFVWEEEKEI